MNEHLLDIGVDIVTKIIIPVIKNRQSSILPSSFVDSLLWIPSKGVEKPLISYFEIGVSKYIKCSEIATTDEVFEDVEKQ